MKIKVHHEKHIQKWACSAHWQPEFGRIISRVFGVCDCRDNQQAHHFSRLHCCCTVGYYRRWHYTHLTFESMHECSSWSNTTRMSSSCALQSPFDGSRWFDRAFKGHRFQYPRHTSTGGHWDYLNGNCLMPWQKEILNLILGGWKQEFQSKLWEVQNQVKRTLNSC